MFWKWNELWRFMETEPGHHESQSESVSQRLMGRTFWGDYGGDTLNRFHYEMLLELYPDAVKSIEHSHGQSLVLAIGTAMDPRHVRGVIDFLAYFDPKSDTFGDYPLYEELWSYSEWEWELTQKEMTTGWWAEYFQNELDDYFCDWEDNTMVPAQFSTEWSKLVDAYCSKNDWDDIETYWESADSLIVNGWDTEAVAMWLLERYAGEISSGGNPPTL
jgi:hypothetical protein